MNFKIIIEVDGKRPSPQKLQRAKAAAEEAVIEQLAAEAQIVNTRVELLNDTSGMLSDFCGACAGLSPIHTCGKK